MCTNVGISIIGFINIDPLHGGDIPRLTLSEEEERVAVAFGNTEDELMKRSSESATRLPETASEHLPPELI
jgi:hypothetical protein